jgi:hypothetical protein
MMYSTMTYSVRLAFVLIAVAILPIVAMAQAATQPASKPASQPASMPTSRPASQPVMAGAGYSAEWVASFQKAEQLRDAELAHIDSLIAVEAKDLKATIALAEVENKIADYTQRRANSHGGGVATDKFIAEYKALQQQKAQTAAQLSEVTAADIKKSSPAAVVIELKKILADLHKQREALKTPGTAPAMPPASDLGISGTPPDEATWKAAYLTWKKAEVITTPIGRGLRKAPQGGRRMM